MAAVTENSKTIKINFFSGTSMARTSLDPENMFEVGVVRELISVNRCASSGGIIGISFLFSLILRYLVCSH